jgi:hypothetical protein
VVKIDLNINANISLSIIDDCASGPSSNKILTYAVATLGMFESLGKILEGILSTQLPNTVLNSLATGGQII